MEIENTFCKESWKAMTNEWMSGFKMWRLGAGGE